MRIHGNYQDEKAKKLVECVLFNHGSVYTWVYLDGLKPVPGSPAFTTYEDACAWFALNFSAGLPAMWLKC